MTMIGRLHYGHKSRPTYIVLTVIIVDLILTELWKNYSYYFYTYIFIYIVGIQFSRTM